MTPEQLSDLEDASVGAEEKKKRSKALDLVKTTFRVSVPKIPKLQEYLASAGGAALFSSVEAAWADVLQGPRPSLLAAVCARIVDDEIKVSVETAAYALPRSFAERCRGWGSARASQVCVKRTT
jgi:hypothetical protein